MADTFRALCAELVDAWLKGDDIVGAMNRARAALAEADEPAAPAPPADGEVAELVAWLEEKADDYECIGCEDSAARCNRAAELLQRQVLVPVPVSERPPEDQLCWWFEPDEEDDEAYGSSWTLLRICGGTSSYTHWLPAHALPLPEVNNG